MVPTKVVRGLLLGLALLALAVPSGAAVTVPSTASGAPPATELPVVDGKIQLALDQAVGLALEHNLGLRVQRFVRSESWFGILQSRGVYDLNLTGELTTLDNTSAQVSQITASSFKQQTFNLGLDRNVPTGANLALDFNNTRQESDVVFNALNPSYDSFLRLSAVQPLLRNFGRDAIERGIRIARADSAASKSEFERQVVDTVQQVTVAYWNLVAARDQLKVAEESLGLAKELHERNKIQVNVGTMAPLELVQSEAAIATREEDIIRAQAAVGDAADQLRQLLDVPAGGAWTADVVPTTEPETERVTLDVEESLATAYASRPEIRAQESAIEHLEVESDYFRNQKKPRLDLSLGYRFNGAGGTLRRDPVTGAPLAHPISGGFSDDLNQIKSLDFRGWSAGLTFGLPLENRTARAQSLIANLNLEQGRVTLDQVKSQITTEVRTAVRAVLTAAKQIDAARFSVTSQEKNLEAEKKRYENGISTSFRINQIQDDLTQARSREVSAIVNYRTSLAAYYKAIGKLLDQHNVEIEEPAGEPKAAGGIGR